MSLLGDLKARFTKEGKADLPKPRSPNADRDLFIASEGFADMRARYADRPNDLYTELLAMEAEVMQMRDDDSAPSVQEAASYWWEVVYDEPMNEVNVERRLTRAVADQERLDGQRPDRLA